MHSNPGILDNIKGTGRVLPALILICVIIVYGIGYMFADKFLSPNTFTVAASSQYGTFGPGLAFDGVSSATSTWHSAQSPAYPQWIRCKFKRGKVARSLSIQSQEGGQNHTRAPREFALQGSNDDADYTDLLRVADAGYGRPGEWRRWGFENDEAYRYYRIYITKNGGDPGILAVQEIELR